MFGDFETNRLEFGLEVQIPNTARIFSTINVLLNIKYLILGIIPGEFASLGDFHVHGSSCRSLRVS
jgi:hypothetical protein